MDRVDDLLLIGLSHRTTPVALRERYAVRPEDAPALLRELVQTAGLHEAGLISTCNRTEALLVAPHPEEAEQVLRRTLFRNLPDEHLYVFRGVHAVIHLFRVGAGLDSLVLGETEILGQMRRAVDQAREADSLGPLLKPLYQQVLSAGKRVRTETRLGEGTLSVARVAVDVARQAYGDLGDNRCLIVGAGETGRLTARHLVAEGARTVDFANRTLSRAEEAAAEFGGRAFGLDRLPEALRGVDLVVVCLDGAPELVTRAAFDARAVRRHHLPTLVVDLSVPRGVSEDLRRLDNLLLYDLDDLQPVVERNRRQRDDAREQVDALLVGEVHKFLALRTYASFSPAIAELARRVENLREEVLDQVTGGKATSRELELAHEFGRRARELFLAQLKEGARAARSEEALDRLYQRFLDNL